MGPSTPSGANDSIDRVERIPRQVARWLRANLSGVTMDKTVADLNIAHFRKLLSTEADPVKRQTLERLLADEVAKLERARAAEKRTADKA